MPTDTTIHHPELPNMTQDPIPWGKVPKAAFRILIMVVCMGLWAGFTSGWTADSAQGATVAAPTQAGETCYTHVAGGMVPHACDPKPMGEAAKTYYQCLGSAAIGLGSWPVAGAKAAITAGTTGAVGCGWSTLFK